VNALLVITALKPLPSQKNVNPEHTFQELVLCLKSIVIAVLLEITVQRVQLNPFVVLLDTIVKKMLRPK
jgi:hypothetical protein